MTLSQIPLLLLFLLPLAYSPGPGNMFFAALGARFGLRAAWPANIGYHIATLIVSFAIGMGFSVFLAPQSGWFKAVQVLGGLYVLWLAWRLYRSQSEAKLRDVSPAGALEGAALLLLNPKGYLIMALMFSQFPAEAIGNTAMIAAIFTLNNMLAFVVWTAAGSTLARWFNSPKAAHRLNTGFAAALALVALWLLGRNSALF